MKKRALVTEYPPAWMEDAKRGAELYLEYLEPVTKLLGARVTAMSPGASFVMPDGVWVSFNGEQLRWLRAACIEALKKGR